MLDRKFRVVAAGLSAVSGIIGLQLGVLPSALAQPSVGQGVSGGYEVARIFTPTGLTTDQGYPLTKPDDLVHMGQRIFVAFQNGVGSTGGAGSNGNTQSSLLELSPDGHLLRQWDLTGKIDGLGVDPTARAVVATVNEDGGSSLYTIDPDARDSGVTHYCYSQALPHGGGTDSVAFYGGKLIISASAPNPSPANVPAVYAATLEPDVHPTNCPAGTAPATGTALVAGGFSDTAPTTAATPGTTSSALALTDPDSSTVVPSSSPRFGGSYLLDSQGDDQQIYTNDPIGGSNLNVLRLTQSVDDTAFITSKDGSLYVTDPTTNSVDRITGPFERGQAYVAVTPCNDNNAPSSCPDPPKWPANYVGRLDLATGQVTTISTAVNPVGMIFVPDHEDSHD